MRTYLDKHLKDIHSTVDIIDELKVLHIPYIV